MKKEDARSLSASAKEVLRKRAVKAVKNGMSQKEAARVFGVHRGTISKWYGQYCKKGEKALEKKQQGRPAGQTQKLLPWQCALVVRTILGKFPDQLRFPFPLWTREAVRQYILQKFGIELSLSTTGRLLKKWGLTPQRPAKRAYEQNPEEVKQWLKEIYPLIAQRAKEEKAEIQWLDESGIRSDDQKGTTYGRKGITPGVPHTGKRFRCNMLSSLTNHGTLRFMLYTGRFDAQRFISFLDRLRRSKKSIHRKVFVIADRHPVHYRAKKVKRWLEKHKDEIELFFCRPMHQSSILMNS